MSNLRRSAAAKKAWLKRVKKRSERVLKRTDEYFNFRTSSGHPQYDFGIHRGETAEGSTKRIGFWKAKPLPNGAIITRRLASLAKSPFVGSATKEWIKGRLKKR